MLHHSRLLRAARAVRAVELWSRRLWGVRSMGTQSGRRGRLATLIACLASGALVAVPSCSGVVTGGDLLDAKTLPACCNWSDTLSHGLLSVDPDYEFNNGTPPE